MTTDELQQIMGEAQHDILNAYIASRSIVIFMRPSGFRLLTAQDGSLKWDIFRDMRYMM